MTQRRSYGARAAAGPVARASFPARLLLGLAPFIAFALLLGLSMSMALWVAFALAFTLGLQAFLDAGTIRPFDAANTALFGLAAVLAGFIPPNMTATAVRLIVEGILLAIMLMSFARRRPFTRQYGADDETSTRRHLWMSVGWVLALTTMSVADTAAIFAGLPDSAASIAGLVVVAGALAFTLRYPTYGGGAQPN